MSEFDIQRPTWKVERRRGDKGGICRFTVIERAGGVRYWFGPFKETEVPDFIESRRKQFERLSRLRSKRPSRQSGTSAGFETPAPAQPGLHQQPVDHGAFPVAQPDARRRPNYVLDFLLGDGEKETTPLRAADQIDAISEAKLYALRAGSRDFQVRAVASNVHTLIYRSK